MCYYSTLHINCIALSEKRPKFSFKRENTVARIAMTGMITQCEKCDTSVSQHLPCRLKFQ